MLHLLYGIDWQKNADAALDRLLAAEAPAAGRNLLIVPEQFSFDAEWRLCERGGDGVSRVAEVLSFTRLYDRVCSVCGGAATRILDNSGRLIAMAGALEQVRSRLKTYGVHTAKPEFLLQLLALYEEFRSCGVDRDGLASAQNALEGRLAQKLEELQLIFESYEAVCSGAVCDPATRLSRLAELLHEQDFAAGCRICIDGFSDFTKQELDVITALLGTAADVTVTLCCDDLREGQEVFSVTRQTAAELRKRAADCGVGCDAARLPPGEKPPALGALRASLFGAGAAKAEADDALSLYIADSPDEEALRAIAEIQTLIQGERCRLREIAVAVSDMTLYQPVLERLFARYRIPAYFSGSKELLQTPVVRMLLSALRAASGRMASADVLDYLKSGAAPIERDACDRLENYALVWGLNDVGWERPFTHNPHGYDDRTPPEHYAPELERLNAARETAVAPLVTLRHALRQKPDTGSKILALYDFMTQIGLPERLSAQAEAFEAAGDFRLAQQTAQIYDILIDALEQIYTVLGRSERTPEDFYQFFRAALSRHNVGTIPATLDSVRVGSLQDLRNCRAAHLFVLGATDGLLPAQSVSRGLLNRMERRRLHEIGLSISPEEELRLSRELLCAYTVFTAPSETLFVAAQRETPSYLFERMKKLFADRLLAPRRPLPATPLQAAALLAAEGPLPAEAGPALQEAAAALRKAADYTPGTLSPETVRALYGQTPRLSASQVDKLGSCKCAYFLNYGLSAKERRPAKVDQRVYGTFIHEVLERCVNQVMEEGGFHVVSAERVQALAEQYMDDFIARKLPGLDEQPDRAQFLFRRCRDEVQAIVLELWNELSAAEFYPVAAELHFDAETAIRIHGRLTEAVLHGYVDRIDRFDAPDGRSFIRVVDYKSGTKDFDYTDILSGMGLQMLIYLYALTQSGPQYFGKDVQSAGVLYFPTKRSELSDKLKKTPEGMDQARRNDFKRKGLLLDDRTVLKAMDPNAENTSTLLSYKYVKKDGSTKGLATPERFELLRRFVFDKLAELTDVLAQGTVAPDPWERGNSYSSCKYCEYKTVCHVNGGTIPIRSLEATEESRFWEILQQQEAQHG